LDEIVREIPPAVRDQVDRLVRAVRLLPAGEAATALEQVITTLQATQAEVLVTAERNGELRDSGCGTVRSFATTVLRRSVNDASATARLALNLVSFPKLASAHREGLASTANLRMVMSYIRACGLDALQAHEDQLLLLTTKTGPGEVKQFCQALADLQHPDRDKARVNALGLRQVRIVRVGDLAHLDAMLDPVVAEQLKAALATMAKDSRAGGDTRSHAERTADALEEVVLRGMSDPALPNATRRYATVTVDLETLLGMPGHGQAILSRFGMIPGRLAERIACDALVRLVVTHGGGVLNVGRTQRVVTGRQRAALATLHPTCAMPGCVVRFTDCEVHHLWWWSLGGPTDLDLQVPLCRSHHAWLHDGGYTVTREDGALVFRDPRGHPIANHGQILADQLDLLKAEHRRPGLGPAPGPDLDAGRAADVPLLQGDEGVSTPYRCGSWGWTGRDPSPPPGHAPPLAG
jgi:hypothetical protein